MRPIQIGPWPAGMNNRLPSHSIPEGAVRNAVNVDIDNAGNLRRRKGYTKVYSGLNVRYPFVCDAGTFFIQTNNLMQLHADNTASLVDAGWLGSVCYEYFNGTVYMSDGTRTAKLTNGVVTDYADMPPCSILSKAKGRLYGVSGSVVWYTDPFTETVDQKRNFLQFTKDVTVFAPVSGGIWIVADKTYFYAGQGPENFMPVVKLEYGALPGTAFNLPNGDGVAWYSARGVVYASDSGEIKNVQEKNVAPDTGTSGASVLIEEDGVKKLVVSVENPSLSPIAARDWMDMEIVRRAQ